MKILQQNKFKKKGQKGLISVVTQQQSHQPYVNLLCCTLFTQGYVQSDTHTG